MGSPQNWPQPINAKDSFRETDKRVQHLERRPQIRKASDILGPGLAPYAVEINDFNSDTAAFNGIFYAPPGTLNSPDTLKWWVGQVFGLADGSGIQEFRTFKDPDWPPSRAIRNFEVIADPFRTYSIWTVT